MAPHHNRRLATDDLLADRHALSGVQLLTNYAPTNAAYSAGTLIELGRAMEAAQQAEVRAAQALAVARDLAVAAEWALHDGLLGAKAQVIAQYGPDAHAVELVGLKRKSERRRPARRATVMEGT
jgi:hypothetical protein